MGTRATRVALIIGLAGGIGAGCNRAKKAREMSEPAVAQIEAHFQMLPEDHPATEWGAHLLELVVMASADTKPKDFNYTYRVIVEHAPNAFTTPDGHIYMTTGLLNVAGSCAEIVGVLGHEVGHVMEHHAVKRMGDAEAAGCAGELIFGSGSGSDAFELGGMILAGTAFSRQDESEADEVGVKLAAAAGYAPDAIIDFFERQGDDQMEASFWSTHPAGGARIQAVRALVADLPTDGARDCAVGGHTLATVQKRLNGRSR